MTFVAPRIVNDVSYVTRIKLCVAGAVLGEGQVSLFVAGAVLGAGSSTGVVLCSTE